MQGNLGNVEKAKEGQKKPLTDQHSTRQTRRSARVVLVHTPIGDRLRPRDKHYWMGISGGGDSYSAGVSRAIRAHVKGQSTSKSGPSRWTPVQSPKPATKAQDVLSPPRMPSLIDAGKSARKFKTSKRGTRHAEVDADLAGSETALNNVHRQEQVESPPTRSQPRKGTKSTTGVAVKRSPRIAAQSRPAGDQSDTILAKDCRPLQPAAGRSIQADQDKGEQKLPYQVEAATALQNGAQVVEKQRDREDSHSGCADSPAQDGGPTRQSPRRGTKRLRSSEQNLESDVGFRLDGFRRTESAVGDPATENAAGQVAHPPSRQRMLVNKSNLDRRLGTSFPSNIPQPKQFQKPTHEAATREFLFNKENGAAPEAASKQLASPDACRGLALKLHHGGPACAPQTLRTYNYAEGQPASAPISRLAWVENGSHARLESSTGGAALAESGGGQIGGGGAALAEGGGGQIGGGGAVTGEIRQKDSDGRPQRLEPGNLQQQVGTTVSAAYPVSNVTFSRIARTASVLRYQLDSSAYG